MPAAPRTAKADAPEDAAPKKSRWIALANLSLGRTGDREKLADIVHKGESVDLTEEQSHGFLTRHKVPVIKPYSERREADPAIKARDLFGRRPGPPADARPDPVPDPERRVLGHPLGASVVTGDPERAAAAPEANDPQTDLNVDPDAAKDK